MVETGSQNTLKIVVFCLSPLGDALFATPAVRALREKFPQAHMLMIATPAAANILKSNPFRIQVLTVKNHLELFPLLTTIRKYHYDLAVGLSPLGGFWARFCKTPLRADLSMIQTDDGASVVESCLAVLKTIGIPSDGTHSDGIYSDGIYSESSATEFWMSPREKIQYEASVQRFLEKTGWHFKNSLITVHCGGHYFVRKRWPVAHFMELIHQLQSGGRYQVVLIGGAEDLPDSRKIKDEIPKVLNAVGKLKLIETAVLLSKCRLMIGNDSGPLHLGAAVGVPTIGLFGPTSPRQFYPYVPPDHLYCYHNFPCSPCYRYRGRPWQYLPRCAQAYCMEAITPLEVFNLAQQFLNEPARLSLPAEASPPQEALPLNEASEVKEWG